MVKHCNHCNKDLPFPDSFSKKTKLHYRAICKKCDSKQAAARIKKARKEMTERVKEIAGNKCNICQRDKPVVIDHCHKTNIIRGVHCTRCNVSLGGFGDNSETLLKAYEYLTTDRNFGEYYISISKTKDFSYAARQNKKMKPPTV